MATGATDLPDFTELNLAPIFFTYCNTLLCYTASFLVTRPLFQSKSQELPKIYTTEMNLKKRNEKLPQIETPPEK